MAINLTAAIPLQDSSQVGEARRAATLLAQRLGFDEERAGRVALVATELATNLVKHARGGEFLIRPIGAGDGETVGLEMLALDRGPGIPDVALSRRDGVSTTGTLGHGLSAIERQSNAWDIYTHASGTAILSQVWRRDGQAAAPQGAIQVGAVNVSMAGEPVCGDAWEWRLRDNRLAVLVADGLGHGVHAGEAAHEAVAVFRRQHEQSPQRLVEDVHKALRSTRGAAVGILVVDLEAGLVRYSGLGNVTCVIFHPDGTRQSLVSHNGTAGHSAARVQEFQSPFHSNALIVLYTDGLGNHWDLHGYPGLRMRHPSLVAGVLYRDHSRRRDDVTVVVARQPRMRDDGNR